MSRLGSDIVFQLDFVNDVKGNHIITRCHLKQLVFVSITMPSMNCLKDALDRMFKADDSSSQLPMDSRACLFKRGVKLRLFRVFYSVS